MSGKLIEWVRTRKVLLVTLVGLMGLISANGRSQLAQKERELLFRIEPGNASWYSGLPTGIKEFTLAVPSAATAQYIHGWWWPAAASNAPAILYLHGSRWNLTGHLFRISQLHDLGFSVLAIDYRGFGKSQGELPSEAAVYEDARLAWQRLTELQPDPARRFIYGHSLGGAVAVELAQSLSKQARSDKTQLGASGLIVESTFTSLGDAAEAVANTKWPIRWLLSQKFDSVDKISDVDMPVLLVHGTSDRYVPARFSEELYAVAAEPKKLLLVEGGTHNNSMRMAGAEFRKALRDLFGLGKKVKLVD